ncbi:hypothetical protein OGATHE_002049 [Ogataea polymorpha]|uniref:Uncharacterized protein n=1 Tax=Ogataea polymorpha TaxID=460523 RepID=A0A9P8PMR2_9ASCO|nr:hypothetical protein OGATHE_002049 [Ogataea polymorpha]
MTLREFWNTEPDLETGAGDDIGFVGSIGICALGGELRELGRSAGDNNAGEGRDGELDDMDSSGFGDGRSMRLYISW